MEIGFFWLPKKFSTKIQLSNPGNYLRKAFAYQQKSLAIGDQAFVNNEYTGLNAKVKIFFDVCHFFFDLFRFRSRICLVWMGSKVTRIRLNLS